MIPSLISIVLLMSCLVFMCTRIRNLTTPIVLLTLTVLLRAAGTAIYLIIRVKIAAGTVALRGFSQARLATYDAAYLALILVLIMTKIRDSSNRASPLDRRR